MSNIPITSLPITNPLTGEEAVPIVQAGTTKRTTTGAISALPFGQGSTFASGISFITVTTSTVVLPSSRVLAAAFPITLTDAGTSNTLTIGLGITPGTGTVTSVGLSGGTTGLTISNSPITTSGTMTISGVLGVPNGGTGTNTITANALLVGDSVGSSVTRVANGTTGTVLTSTGASSPPTFQVPFGSFGSSGQLLVGQSVGTSPVWRTLVGDISMTAAGTANASNAVGHALLNLAGAQGIVVITSATTATQRLIAGGAGITVTNGDGASGNPTVAVTPGQIPGTTTNDSATAGNVGEFISSAVELGAALSLTTATPRNITTISIGGGDWDVSSIGYFGPAGTTLVTSAISSISTSSATLNSAAGRIVAVTIPAAGFVGGTGYAAPIANARLNVAGTTTVYLVSQASFSTSTMTAFGIISARRCR